MSELLFFIIGTMLGGYLPIFVNVRCYKFFVK